jgi:hypothetical protein
MAKQRLGPRTAKEYAPYIEAFTRLGGQVHKTGSGHYRLVPPTDQYPVLVLSASPSGPSALHKLKSLVRKMEVGSPV